MLYNNQPTKGNHMDYLIKSEGAVLGFCVKKQYIDFLCKKTLYKFDKESETVIYKKEIFEKEGMARIMTADENRIYISDFCTLYVLDGNNYELIVKLKIGENLSSDICGMATDKNKVYCSVRNGSIVTVDKSSFEKKEYHLSESSMWSLKIYGNKLLCGTVDGQLLLLEREKMSINKKLILSKQNIRSLYLSDKTLYAACQNKKLFKIDLEEFEVTGLQKNAHNKMFDCVGIYEDMLLTVSYPCGEIALWDINTLEKRKEFKTALSLSGSAYIEENKLYITSRNIYGIGIIYLNLT